MGGEIDASILPPLMATDAYRQSTQLWATLTQLHDQQRQLLGVIAGLRERQGSPENGAADLNADLEIVACRALAEVALLIREVERLSACVRLRAVATPLGHTNS